MVKSDLSGPMARELLDRRFDGEGMPSGVVVQELWC
jgi:hypothetical protein